MKFPFSQPVDEDTEEDFDDPIGDDDGDEKIRIGSWANVTERVMPTCLSGGRSMRVQQAV